jgi:4-amino-4-deoxy-L-arabinose transferase-like glycosyltransferase
MSWWKSPKTFPLRIFLIALVVRLIPVLATRSLGIGLDDMFQYDMLARSIAAGNGYRWYAEADLPTVLPYLKLDLASINYDPRGVLTSFRPPLYPVFLALIYLVFGVGTYRFFFARLIQTVLGALIAPLTYALAKRLFPNRDPAARISALVITLYPMLVIYPISLATENLFFVLVLCSILALLIAKESLDIALVGKGKVSSFFYRSRWFMLSGLLLGLTCLTRSVAQVLTLFAVIWVWLFLKERSHALIVLMMAGLVVIPWIVRNSLIYRQFTGIETALGYDLYLGYNPNGTGTFQYPQSLDLMTIVNDAERDKVGMQDTIGFIKADPGRVIYLLIRRAGYFFSLERRAITYFYSNDYFGHISTPVLGGIFALFCLPFTVISTTGVASLPLITWRKETWLLALFLVGYITPHLLIISEDRFHLAIVPFLAILAAQFWSGGRLSIQGQWLRSNSGKVVLILTFIIILLLLSNWGLELCRDADKLTLLFGSNGNQTYFSY